MSDKSKHRSKHCYLVHKWINSDMDVYELMKECIKTTKNKQSATEKMLEILEEIGITHTPDGIKLNKTNIFEAMAGE